MGTYTLLVDPGGNGYGPTLSFRWTNSKRVYFGNRLIWRGGSAVYTDRLGSVGKYFPYGEERPSATVGDAEKFGRWRIIQVNYAYNWLNLSEVIPFNVTTRTTQIVDYTAFIKRWAQI
jgi:hypothetical protein